MVEEPHSQINNREVTPLNGGSYDVRDVQLAMQADRFRLRQLWKRLDQARRDGKPFDRSLAQFSKQIAESIALRDQRQRSVPTYVFDEDLPITARRQEIGDAIRDNQVVVICGETGSGKSTQIPKICLDVGRGVEGLIGHTQPRRIAARSVAARLAEELQSPLGAAVGFKIRFTDATSPATYVKLMTDGILLAETQNDHFLDQYDTIIIDEAHERSLNIDFLLGYLKRLLTKRHDLRLIITSATIDVERFAEHFASEKGPAPIIHVSGRTYPVDVWYRAPHTAEDDDEPDRNQGVLDAVDELFAHDRFGDVLVFLSTEREILDVTKSLRGRLVQSSERCEILPLYARLSANEQNRVFEKHSQRRIILATNVAESSLTVPGIRYVIDSGTARISRYAPRSRMQRLPIEPISQASADQRKGRCGRLGPGICVRLYSEEDFLNRDRFTTPEIRRSNLAAVILQAEALRLGAIEEFPFLDPPQPNLIRDGYTTLFELGAVDDDGALTALGKRLSRLPVDPRIGRMILAAMDEGCLREVLIIASALEVQDPRERPVDKQAAADEAHRQFADADSDFLTYLNLWNFYHDLKEKLSRNQLQKACHQNFLSHIRIREWLDVHRQLQRMLHEIPAEDLASHRVVVHENRRFPKTPLGNQPNERAAKNERDAWYTRIHKALMTGLLSSIALRSNEGEYTGAGNLKLNLWPGSATFASTPKWIMAAEFVETTRRYARTVARINPDWIEPLATHLVNRSYSDPHWQEKHGNVVAYEKVSLFGLTISSGRLVPYGKIDPELCRDLFIRQGLVQGELQNAPPFLAHNRKMREEAERLMAKTRRTDLSVDDFAIYSFYSKRVPQEVHDLTGLNRWRKTAEQTDPKLLFMQVQDMTAAKELPDSKEFPDQIQIDKMRLPVEYAFEPGADRDGVTIVVPKAALGHLAPERLGWLVPGLLEHKVTSMVKSLPKSLRRNLGPAPDVVKSVLSQLKFGEGRLVEQVASILTRIAGETISVDNFTGERLPSHLNMNVRVIDDKGKTVGEGRDLGELRDALGVAAGSSIVGNGRDDPKWHRDNITRWDFGALPESIDVVRGGVTLTAFPALIDQGNSVGLRLFDRREEALKHTRAGIRRLFVLSEHRSLKAHVDWFPEGKQLPLWASGVYSAGELRDDLAALIADRAFIGDRPLARSAEAYSADLHRGRDQVEAAVQDIVKASVPLFKNYHAARLALEKDSKLYQYAIDDMRRQLKELMPRRFLLAAPWAWLQHYPRYLDAMRIRLQKLGAGGVTKDRQAFGDLERATIRFRQRVEELEKQRGPGNVDPVTLPTKLEEYRWLLEEFRVSLFAQQLGTSTAVSAKRIDKLWEEAK